ncbi:MAG: DUF1553 domain-containing protein [Acidobacteria bacterium]|nr:DUF1553 domain-containing protein [Acidobacteriota bacterium]MCB9398376.1 DUF1553 domain-containing protein [Acidobacteriota bacterium]
MKYLLLLLVTLPLLAQSDLDSYKQVECAQNAQNLVDDLGFLRRIYIDLTGKLPNDQEVEAFLANPQSDKRAQLIDQLLVSSAFVDRWTFFLEELFVSTRLVEEGLFRNAFHDTLRTAMVEQKSWDQITKDVLTYSGLSVGSGSSQTYFKEMFRTDYRLDYLDDQASFTSRAFLGVNFDCISCHDGAYHLEDINKGLSVMRRQQLWEMAAFFSAMYAAIPYEYARRDDVLYHVEMVDLDGTGYSQRTHFLIGNQDTPPGEYLAQSEAGQGMRKPREGDLVSPRYYLDGATPQPGESRRMALARMIVQDPQFARNFVNRVWAHFFGRGFVEPLDGWDLARLTPESAAAFETSVQAISPDLLNFLADRFSQSGFDIRQLIRTIVLSKVYQWDYLNQADPCDDSFSYWRENRRTRRLEAESLLDAFASISGFPARYIISGKLDQPVTSAWQLPSTDEPNPYALFMARDDGSYGLRVTLQSLGFSSLEEFFFLQEFARTTLAEMGRGSREDGVPRTSKANIQNTLRHFNANGWNYYLETLDFYPRLKTKAQALEAGLLTREDVIQKMFREMLFRAATDEEVNVLIQGLSDQPANQVVANLFWVLLNHPDFLYY